MGQDPRVLRKRFVDLINELRARGISQRALAEKLEMHPQYISDIKRGIRPVSDNFTNHIAKKLSPELVRILFTGASQPGDLRRLMAGSPTDQSVELPVLHSPIAGNPKSSTVWNGDTMTLAGIGAIAAREAKRPYVLALQHVDVWGRLRPDDRLLISQKPVPGREVCLLQTRAGIVLARKRKGSVWRPIKTGKVLKESAKLVGSVVAIIWARL